MRKDIALGNSEGERRSAQEAGRKKRSDPGNVEIPDNREGESP